MIQPTNLDEALAFLSAPNIPDNNRWELLAIILREFALSQGIDLEHEIENTQRKANG